MSKQAKFIVLALAMGLTFLVAGCGKADRIRGLSSSAADQLLARQAAKQNMDRGEQEELTPAQMEAKGDREAVEGKWLSSLLYYGQAIKKTETPAITGRLTGKLGMVHLKIRSYQDAERFLKKALVALPNQGNLWRGLGYACLGMGKLAQAEKALNRALAINGRDWRAANALGVAYNWQRQPNRALMTFQRALAVKPGHPGILNNLGLSFLLLNKTHMAEQAFLASLQAKDSDSRAANNLGVLYAKMGRNEEALKAFTRAVGRAKAHNNLGLYLAWQGDTLAASDQFRKAIEISPRYYQRAGQNLRQINGDGPGLDQN